MLMSFIIFLQIFKVTAKLKSIMMEAGTLMVSYQPLGELPNFFRSIISNVASREEDIDFMLSEMERLGKHLQENFPSVTQKKNINRTLVRKELQFEMLRQQVLHTIRGVNGFDANDFCTLTFDITSVVYILMRFNEINVPNNFLLSMKYFLLCETILLQMLDISD